MSAAIASACTPGMPAAAGVPVDWRQGANEPPACDVTGDWSAESSDGAAAPYTRHVMQNGGKVVEASDYGGSAFHYDGIVSGHTVSGVWRGAGLWGRYEWTLSNDCKSYVEKWGMNTDAMDRVVHGSGAGKVLAAAPPPAATAGAAVASPAVPVHASTTSDSAAQTLPRIWSVAVGISKFTAQGISLDFADRDATSVDGFYASAAGGGVPAERRVLLTNGDATRAAILEALTALARRTAPDDLLIIFLATHGLPDPGGDLYFVASDTDPRQIVATGLPERDIEYALSKAPARRVVLLVDACHAGAAGLAGLSGRRGLVLSETNTLVGAIAAAKTGVALLSAASSSESSIEGPQWDGGHGVFTNELIAGLHGAADANKDGLVTVRELFDFTYRAVSEATQGNQHPELKGTFDNALPLAQVPSHGMP